MESRCSHQKLFSNSMTQSCVLWQAIAAIGCKLGKASLRADTVTNTSYYSRASHWNPHLQHCSHLCLALGSQHKAGFKPKCDRHHENWDLPVSLSQVWSPCCVLLEAGISVSWVDTSQCSSCIVLIKTKEGHRRQQ